MDRITGKTVLTGLLGRPVSHSISPLMHNAAFEADRLDYAYLCFDIGEQELDQAVAGLKVLGARGWNCTMPDKKRMAQLCDTLSLAASVTGSVNTVVNENGVLKGYSTDGTGYMMALKDAGYDIIGGRMTLFGAGGAALAILAQAAIDGLESIQVCSRQGRSFDQAVMVADRLNKETDCKVTVLDLADQNAVRQSIDESTILTNATSVGMAPNADACLIPDASWLHRELIVSDIIYNPRKTKLMAMAEEAGCPVCGGLYMLLYQGAEAYRLWTGKPMQTELIKERYFSGR